MTINGISEVVNKTLIRTTLSRLNSSFGITTFIVDIYGWLHAGKHVTGVVEILSCNLPCPPLYAFIERRLAALSLHGKFQVILVFDGPSSNQKHATDTERNERRLKLRKEGLEAQSVGDYAKSTALLRSSVDITVDIAKEVLNHLNSLSAERKRAIGLKRCVVSINEADPLISLLNNQINNSCGVMADYDALPWNLKKNIFKIDYHTGIVHLFIRDVFDVSAVVSTKLLHSSHFQLIDCCVLAGCDYVKNIKGEGFKKAVKNIRRYGVWDSDT